MSRLSRQRYNTVLVAFNMPQETLFVCLPNCCAHVTAQKALFWVTELATPPSWHTSICLTARTGLVPMRVGLWMSVDKEVQSSVQALKPECRKAYRSICCFVFELLCLEDCIHVCSEQPKAKRLHSMNFEIWQNLLKRAAERTDDHYSPPDLGFLSKFHCDLFQIAKCTGWNLHPAALHSARGAGRLAWIRGLLTGRSGVTCDEPLLSTEERAWFRRTPQPRRAQVTSVPYLSWLWFPLL